jgi:hypothetical protein
VLNNGVITCDFNHAWVRHGQRSRHLYWEEDVQRGIVGQVLSLSFFAFY